VGIDFIKRPMAKNIPQIRVDTNVTSPYNEFPVGRLESKFMAEWSDNPYRDERGIMTPATPSDSRRCSWSLVLLSALVGGLTVGFIWSLCYAFTSGDTWETDNSRQIIDKCEAVHRAIAESRFEEAAEAHEELSHFLANHKVQSTFLLQQIEEAQQAVVSIGPRIDLLRKDRAAKEFLRHSETREATEYAGDKPRAIETTPAYRDALQSGWQTVNDVMLDVQQRDLSREAINEGIERIDSATAKLRAEMDRSINRRHGERGYSLAVRQEAMRRTLIQLGYSPREAELTVRDMTAMGLLPDPPCR
jgi:hypothetical protein